MLSYLCNSNKKGVKNNYRTAHDDLVCRWGKADQETQDHILKECPNFQCHTEKLDISKIMNPQRKISKTDAIIINDIYKKINDG